MFLGGRTDLCWIESDLMQDKFVRRQDIDLVFRKNILRKVFEVVRDDDAGTAANCCGEDMAIIRIRQGNCRDEMFVAGHESVRNVPVHQFTRAFKLRARQVRTAVE